MSKILQEEGVTFMELLIVVTIIALLWIEMINIYQGKVEEAQRAVCKSNIAIIQGQLEIYCAKESLIDNKKKFKKFLINKEYFVHKPECPFRLPYTFSAKDRTVFKHIHKIEIIRGLGCRK